MKVRIKNNRLALEGRIPNLSEATDEELQRVAAKYQIGTNTFVEKEVPIIEGGVTKIKKKSTIVNKSRAQLEDDIRQYLTITMYVPKEYWTDEQERAFMENNLMEEKDINRERDIKKRYGIMIILPPFEETGDQIKEASLMAEVTEDQWEFFKKEFNRKYTKLKDKDGKVIGKKESYVHRLVEVDRVPETEEEKKELEKEQEEKNGKKESK